MNNEVLTTILQQSKIIGSAWPLFLYIITKAETGNHIKTTYAEISEELGYSRPAIKKWRARLVNKGVIKSRAGKHNVGFELMNGWEEIIEKNSGEMNPEGNNPFVTVFSDLVQKVARLEVQVAGKN